MRKYNYNAERDRLDSLAWNPSFRAVVLQDGITFQKRNLMICSCTSYDGQVKTIAMRYGKEEESVLSVNICTKDAFLNWLLDGQKEIVIDSETIPTDFVVKYITAMIGPKGGEVDSIKERLVKKDPELLQNIANSFELTKESHDIIRIEDDNIPER